MNEVLSIKYDGKWILSKPYPNDGIAIRANDHWELYNCVVGSVSNLHLYNCVITGEASPVSPKILDNAYIHYKREDKLKRIIDETNGCPL